MAAARAPDAVMPAHQAVRKLRRVFTRAFFVRFFEASDRLEVKKSRKISLCAIAYKISLSFHTAWRAGIQGS